MYIYIYILKWGLPTWPCLTRSFVRTVQSTFLVRTIRSRSFDRLLAHPRSMCAEGPWPHLLQAVVGLCQPLSVLCKQRTLSGCANKQRVWEQVYSTHIYIYRIYIYIYVYIYIYIVMNVKTYAYSRNYDNYIYI